MNPTVDESMDNQTMVADRAGSSQGASIDHRLVVHAGPKVSVLRRLLKTSMMAVLLVGGAIFGLYKMRVDIPGLHTPKFYAYLDDMGVRANELKGRIAGQYESHFGKPKVEEEAHHEGHKILVTTPMAKDVTITQEYVCLIRSQRHIELRALEDGYLEAIKVREGQAVKAGDPLFQVMPVLFKAELAAEVAERDLQKLELIYTQSLAASNGVSKKEVSLYEARLAKAQAKVELAQAKLNFATVRAPFDGIIDRLKEQQGSLVKEGDILTTLSDNSVMWVYFNVPEKDYLNYMAEVDQDMQSPDIELKLADQSQFPQAGKIGTIEANFNPESGNISFRADFENPLRKSRHGQGGADRPNTDRLLRHGQTGKVLIRRVLHGAVVIPQRATFENLAKRYVYVVGEDHVAHQREIVIRTGGELDDIFVIEKGVDVKDQIVLEGIRQVRDGEKLEFETITAEEALKDPKNHAE